MFLRPDSDARFFLLLKASDNVPHRNLINRLLQKVAPTRTAVGHDQFICLGRAVVGSKTLYTFVTAERILPIFADYALTSGCRMAVVVNRRSAQPAETDQI